MNELVFAFMPAYGGDQREARLLAKSIRQFAGQFASAPILMFQPREMPVSAEIYRQLGELSVEIVPFDVPEPARKFPFAPKVYAAAEAEAQLQGQTDLMVWLDSDTIFLGQPDGLLLTADKRLGYRPVQLKNISSPQCQPVDRFWALLYRVCNVPDGRIFPMQTTIDAVPIRPHINAGLLAIRPQDYLMQAWRENFSRLYHQDDFRNDYQADVRYAIFMHQAVLSATILSKFSETDLQDLGDSFNYPIFLREKMSPLLAGRAWSEIISLRYDEYDFFQSQGWQTYFQENPALVAWLAGQIS